MSQTLSDASDEIERLHPLATAHGLQSEQAGRELKLCNVARGIVETLQEVSPIALEFALPEGFTPVEVNAEEVMPIAMILSELGSSALKHVDRSEGRPAS